MAAVAIRVGAGQGVIVIDMAGDAGGGDMRPGQRETCGAVIKIGGAPTESGMAVRAICQCESGARGGMGGIIGLLPGCEVTS